jgi:hypothetical protein
LIAAVAPHVSAIAPPPSAVPRTVQPPDTRQVAATWIAPCQEGEVCHACSGWKDGGRRYRSAWFEHVTADLGQVAGVRQMLEDVGLGSVQNDEGGSPLRREARGWRSGPAARGAATSQWVCHRYCLACSRRVRHQAATASSRPPMRDVTVRMVPPQSSVCATVGGPTVTSSGERPAGRLPRRRGQQGHRRGPVRGSSANHQPRGC